MSFCRKRCFALITLFAFFCLMFPPVQAQAKESVRTVKVESFTGEVQVQRGGDKKITVFEGMRLDQGDTLITGADSSAVIRIDTDKTVNLDENTEIMLDTLAGTETKGQTGISVFFGNIVNTIHNMLTKGSSYETKTSSAIMGVRGTTYLVSQPSEETEVMVSGGTVAVTQNQPEVTGQAADEVPVTIGNQYHVGKDGQIADVIPVDAESLMKLTPLAARALITDELLSTITDKPESLTTVDQLVEVLSVKQQEKKKEIQAQMDEKAAFIADQTEPAAFFESGENRLTGQTVSLISENTAAVGAEAENPNQPEKPPIKDQSNRNDKSMQKPSDQPEASQPDGSHNQNGETQPDMGETGNEGPGSDQTGPDSGLDGDTDESDQGNTGKPGGSGDGSGGSDSDSGGSDQGSGNKPGGGDNGSGNKPGGGDNGSGNKPGGGDDGSGNNPDDGEDGTKPELPEVTIEQLRQERVYVTSEDGSGSGEFAGLAISWEKTDEAYSYQLEMKNSGGEFTVITPGNSYQESGTTCRLRYSSADQAQMNGAVLRITPVVTEGKTAVSKELILDFEQSEISTGIHKLLMPEIKEIRQNEDQMTFVDFKTVRETKSYSIAIFEGEILVEEEVFEAQGGEDDDLTQYQVKKPALSGEISVELKALGDEFNTWSSETDRKSKLFEKPELIQLDPPSEIRLTSQGDGSHLLMIWTAVEGADGYVIRGETTIGLPFVVMRGFKPNGDEIIYDFDLLGRYDIKSLEIKATGDNKKYKDSEWKEVDLDNTRGKQALDLILPDDDKIIDNPDETEEETGAEDQVPDPETPETDGDLEDGEDIKPEEPETDGDLEDEEDLKPEEPETDGDLEDGEDLKPEEPETDGDFEDGEDIKPEEPETDGDLEDEEGIKPEEPETDMEDKEDVKPENPEIETAG